ncbi:MAG: aminoacyl-tRNA hydrolase [Polyangiaceae bacterium]
MWLIVGLGNPGKKYEKTRHNVGFIVVDALREAWGLPAWSDKFSGLFTRGSAKGESVLLLKPQTFMNVSGDSVQPAAAFAKVSVENILVIHDEIDMPFETLKLKSGGGHAGHNGLRSMVDRLGSPHFQRLRFGVGRPGPDFKGDVADFVLGNFPGEQAAKLPDLLMKSQRAIELVLENGIGPAMNAFHAVPKAAQAPKSPKAPKAPTDAPTGPKAKPSEPA